VEKETDGEEDPEIPDGELSDPDSGFGFNMTHRSCLALPPGSCPGYPRRKKEKKETMWRVVARGEGLFFARMHLFTDDSFDKAWMYPPSLRTNETIYAGVVLANGPAEATVSLTR